jgi:hypothetical protein
MFTIKRRCYSVAMRPNPTSPLPDLAMSVVLFHSPLEQLRKLLDSLVAAVLRADLAPVALVCVDNSVDQDYALRCQALCDLYQSEDSADHCDHVDTKQGLRWWAQSGVAGGKESDSSFIKP